MAPRKRKAVGGEEAPAAKPQTTSMRMTRRATRQANLDLNESATELAKAELPKKKAKKAKPAKKPKKEEVKAEETDSEKEKPEGEEAGGDAAQRLLRALNTVEASGLRVADRVVAAPASASGPQVLLNDTFTGPSTTAPVTPIGTGAPRRSRM